jgi:tripartite-type tricarboxylate transporter receptor subunit TctC
MPATTTKKNHHEETIMRILSRRGLLGLLAAAALLCSALSGLSPARAQSGAAGYPSKPIRLIVPWAPGGSTDILARTTAERLTTALGQPVVVENRPGASGNIGAEAVARAAPDGYTLLFTSTNLTLNPAVIPHTPYGPVRDFTGISMVAFAPMMLVTKAGFAGDSLQGLIDYGKAHPGKLNFSSSGAGGAPHLAGEMFRMATGLQMVHVPYTGAAPALTDVLSGQVQMTFTTYISAQGMLAAKQMKALGVASKERLKVVPDVPTFAEQGLDIEIGTMFGLLAPAGTPRPVIDKLYAVIRHAADNQDFQNKILQQGGSVVADDPDHYNAYLREDVAKWAKLIKQLGGVGTN